MPDPKPPCLVPTCTLTSTARGLCTKHYSRARARELVLPGGKGPVPVEVTNALAEAAPKLAPPPVNPEAIAALELPPIQRPRIRPAMSAPERAPADVLQAETREARAAFADSVSRQSGIAINADERDAFAQNGAISPIDPLLQAYEERDLWQQREAAAVERARTAEQERDEALAMHERGWQAARKAGHQEAARALILALDRQPWSLDGLDNELNLSLCAAIVSATGDEQGSKLLKAARAERDEARAESSSHLQFIDALLAASGWKRGEDDSDAAKIAHVGQIIAERASWKESWQRRAQQLAQALGKLPEDVSYQECLAIVRDQREDRDVWNQRVATMMEALPRHLFAGGERLDQMVVGVCELLRRAEETVQPLATRYRTTSLGAIVGAAMLDLERLDAVTTALDQLGAPDAEVGADGVPDSTPATRIGLLIRYWQDAIRSALPGDVDSVDGGGCGGSALDLTLAEIAQGLENAREGDRAGAPPAIEAPSLFQRLVTATPDGGRLIAVEMALDEAKAPAAESLVERIRLLVGAHAQELAEATERADARESELLGHLGAIREALNVGPPSASDVPAGTPWAEVAWIVRARSELMLEERDQRVALGQLVERIAKSTGFATGPLLGQYGPLEEHIRGLAKEAACAARQEEWLAEHLADSTPVLRALVADGCGFVEPLASLIAERAVPAGPGHGPYNERLAVARLFAAHLLSDPCPF